MKNILMDISGKIDDSYIAVIKEIKEIADSLKIPFFIVGAFARDIIMEYCYEIKAQRLTTDIDLGIRVSSWNQFDQLINALELSGKIKKSKEKHRIIYESIFIDLVPFGGISNKDEKISWPPKNEVIMSVVGFKEVFDNSALVRLQNNPPLEVKIPLLPGLAILKLFSWKDSFPNRPKDAEDLLFIMKNYEYAGIDERLYGAESKLLESEDFDNQIAGIVLLGKEMSKICLDKTTDYLRKILEEETSEISNYNLVNDMVSSSGGNFDTILFLLSKLKKGIYY
jgi:predicted nucleotidyltransferase